MGIVRINGSLHCATLLGLVLFTGCYAIPSAAADSPFPVTLRVDGKEISLSTLPVLDGREIYLPLEALRAFGVSYKRLREGDPVRLTFPDGSEREVPLARSGKTVMVPLSALVTPLDARFVVEAGRCEVHLPRRGGEEIIQKAESLDTTSSAPLPPAQDSRESSGVFRPGQKAQSAVLNHQKPAHQNGTAQPTSTQKPAEQPRNDPKPNPPRRPSSPSKKEGAGNRAEIGAPRNPGKKPLSSNPTTGGQTPQGDDSENPLLNPLIPLQPYSDPNNPPVPPGSQAARPVNAPVRITEVIFEATDNAHARVRILTEGKVGAAVQMLSEPSRLIIDIPNSTLATTATEWPVDHPFLSDIRVAPGDKPSVTRVEMRLTKLVGYTLLPPRPDGLTLNLILPRGVGRPIKDLILVLDPGHGGGATGCRFPIKGGCIYEKDLTLTIAKRLQAILSEAGVRVIMTRTTDVDVSLSARPALAAEHNADLFVSIHVDDCPIPNSASGSTAYYHMNDASSRALAQSIIGRIAQVSGLPSRGARSDRVLYVSGLAVLRHSTVPAVLIEMAYINNARDRAQLLTPAWQQKMSQAIFNGIRGYVEGALPETPLKPIEDGE